MLDHEVFASVQEAQACLETQCRWYNEERPLSSSLKHAPPGAFARALQQKQEDKKPPC